MGDGIVSDYQSGKCVDSVCFIHVNRKGQKSSWGRSFDASSTHPPHPASSPTNPFSSPASTRERSYTTSLELQHLPPSPSPPTHTLPQRRQRKYIWLSFIISSSVVWRHVVNYNSRVFSSFAFSQLLPSNIKLLVIQCLLLQHRLASGPVSFPIHTHSVSPQSPRKRRDGSAIQ
jgi:hypothetical protein